MGVDHGGGNVCVIQQILHSANIITSLKQMRGKEMLERVTADAFANSRCQCVASYRLLQAGYMKVMTANGK